jgi:hypothetical protein
VIFQLICPIQNAGAIASVAVTGNAKQPKTTQDVLHEQ